MAKAYIDKEAFLKKIEQKSNYLDLSEFEDDRIMAAGMDIVANMLRNEAGVSLDDNA